MKKDDLISRAAAIEALSTPCDKRYRHGVWETCLDNIETAIRNIPAVNAVPMVHGRWVKVAGYATPGGDPVWKCSECGKGLHVYGIEHGTYGAEVADGQWVSCPNCGARMDGEWE